LIIRAIACLALCVAICRGADIYILPVPQRAVEATWRDALAREIGGRTEYRVPYGRVDVMTSEWAIELDYAHKWHECLGQAIHYGLATDRRGVMALIDEGWANGYLEYVEGIAQRVDVKVIILRRAK
jgi:hypothetical protein